MTNSDISIMTNSDIYNYFLDKIKEKHIVDEIFKLKKISEIYEKDRAENRKLKEQLRQQDIRMEQWAISLANSGIDFTPFPDINNFIQQHRPPISQEEIKEQEREPIK